MKSVVQLPIDEKFKAYEKCEFKIDWVHGFCDSPYVGKFFEDLEALDPELFDFTRFKLQKKGFRNYSVRYNHDDKSEIVICYTPRFDDELDPEDYNPDIHGSWLTTSKDYTSGTNRGIYIQISGDGCRKIGVNNFLAVMQLLYSYNFKCTRFDVACDIYNPECEVLSILHNTFDSTVRAISNDLPICEGLPLFRSKSTRKHIQGYTVIDPYRSDRHVNYLNWEWGHNATAFKFRMYDKWLEMRSVTRHKNTYEEILSSLPLDFWWRLEYELHDDRAMSCFLMFVNQVNACQIFLEVSKSCFTPVFGSDNVIHHATDRLVVQPEWEFFLNFVEHSISYIIDFVQLDSYVPDTKSEDDVLKYTLHMSKSFVASILCSGRSPDILKNVFEIGLQKWFNDPRNKFLMVEYGITSFEDLQATLSYSLDQLGCYNVFSHNYDSILL